MSEPAKKVIYKPLPVSGFPEWLPEYRAVELAWMDKIRKVFESYGFCSIETPSVEELNVLLAKGETDKEIYVVERLHKDDEPSSSLGRALTGNLARLGLHFDLTVPFARYVAQHFNDLTFPFKRYQIQRSWRGERPQKGRFREFYQCDIDVINVDALPLHFDAELPAIMYEAYKALDIPPVQIKLSNRKILSGYLQGLGIAGEDIIAVTRIMDKADKIGASESEKLIGVALNKTPANLQVAQKCIELTKIKTSDTSFVDQVQKLGVKHELLDIGVEELRFVMDNLKHLPSGAVMADLSIVRGFDYYTGTILEAYLVDEPGFGAIGSGGRYDDLAGSFINKHLPGIGISIGLSRLLSKLIDEKKIAPGRVSPTQVLVVLPDESRRAEAAATAHTLRTRGYNVELFHRDAKVKNQLAYAEKKGIPYVWFPPFEDGKPHEVKDMTSGAQAQADPTTWNTK